MKTNRFRKRGLFLMANKLVSVIALIFFSAGNAFALPAGQQVVNGQASFVTQGNNLTITNSPNAIINWQGFSINNNEVVRFIQQYGSSAVLNRVVGQDPSRILGLLQSNGRVFLINPNGILFGQGARIDVNGLFASTLDIGNQDFLAGKYNFTAGAMAGSIQNQGTITTPAGGKVFLIAPDIENSGIINSPQGDVILAAGHSVQLVDSLDPDISVVVSAPENKAVNLGQIVAQSGKVGIYGGLISQRGIVNADSAVSEGGRIFLKATKAIELADTSVISADGAKGGQIIVKTEENGQISGTLTGRGLLSAQGDGSRDSGGFIETSAAKVDLNGIRVRTNGGNWLIDPYNDFTIAASGGDITGTDLSNILDGSNIEILSSDGATAGSGDIFVNDAVTWGNSNTLSLIAHRNIAVNSAITNSAGAGSLNLSAGGDISQIAPISTAGAVTLAAGNDLTTSNTLTTTSNGSITMTAGRSITIGNKVEANGTGNVTLVANNVNSLETDAAGNALAGTGGVGRSTGAAALTVNGAIVSGTGNIKLVNSSASSNGGATGELKLGANVSTHGGIVIQSGGDVIQDAGSITNQLADPTMLGSYDVSIGGSNITLRSVGSQRDVVINAGESLTIATANLNLTSLLGPLSFLDVDDEYFSYTLPFAFNFYGTTYTTVYISSNGMVTFAEPQQSGYPAGFGWSPYVDSVSELANYRVIAAAWNDWMTSTTPLHDIYAYNVSYGGVSGLAIRWDVYRYANTSRTAQFEMMLFSNGNIKFNYGPASEAYGTSTNSGDVTIGLSNAGSTIPSALMNLSDFNMNSLPSTTFTYNVGNYTETVSSHSDWVPANIVGNNSGGASAPGGINAVRSVNITATNVINENIDSSVRNITSQNLSINAGSGIGSGNPLTTAVRNISAVNAVSNNIEIDNTGILTVGDLKNLGTGDVILQNIGGITTDIYTVTSQGGAISITAHSPLTIGSGGVSAYDSITLEASGSDNLTINGNIASSNGNINLSAPGGSVAVSPGISLSAPNGTITLNGGTFFFTDNLAVAGNVTATDSTVSSLMSALEKITSDEKGDDENERKKKTREGGQQTTDDKKTDDNAKNFCN